MLHIRAKKVMAVRKDPSFADTAMRSALITKMQIKNNPVAMPRNAISRTSTTMKIPIQVEVVE